MTAERAAPQGVTSDLRAESPVRWLEPRDAGALRRRADRRPRSLSRLTAALGVGVALTVATADSAVGPAAAHAPLDVAVRATAALAGDAILLAALGAPRDAVDVMLAEAPASAPVELRVAPAAPVDLDLFVGSSAPKLEAEKGDAETGADQADPALESRAQEILRFGAVRIPRPLVEAILRAADATGVDPAYMMALADKESSFMPDIKAPTSSAEGLFQFIERTWLEVVRDFGARHGVQLAASLVETVNGQPTVQNEHIRQWVLELRRDPYLSAVMAAEMMKRDKARIERRIGRELERSELYLMHFLGAESAAKLLELVGAKPKQSAPKVFPAAAKANRTLFFAQEQKKKRPRQLTVTEVYDKLDRMIDTRIDRYEGVTAFLPARASFALQ
jgi:soluble lytic murein transglycosylase-like protein